MPNNIDPTSLTFNQIKNDLIAYLQGRPDYDTWRDFLESGAGTTVVELLAGLGSYISYHSLGARRESYIDTRRLYSSAINLSNSLGYPVNRVSAPRLTLTINRSDPLQCSPITRSKFDPIGQIGDRSISLIESQTIPGGNPGDSSIILSVLVGDWNVENWTATDDTFFQSRLIEADGIDNNFYEDTVILKMDEGSGYAVVELTKYPEEMTVYQLPPLFPILRVLDRTNIDGMVLIFGDGTFGKEVELGDLFQLEYVTTLGILEDFVTLTTEDINLEISGTLVSVEVENPGSGSDSINKLAVVPSGYFSTQRRAVSRSDYINLLLSYSGDLISANLIADFGLLNCCQTVLYYLFSDRHIASSTEETDILDFMENFRMVGNQLLLTNPQEYGLEVKLTVIVDIGTDLIVAEEEIREIIEAQTMKLGDLFKPGVVTSNISKLDYVDRVYFEKPYDDRQLENGEYLYLLTYDITLTTDSSVVVTIDPINVGYIRRVAYGVNDSVVVNYLKDSTNLFDSVKPYDLVINETDELRARVVNPSSYSLELDDDIFTDVNKVYSVYSSPKLTEGNTTGVGSFQLIDTNNDFENVKIGDLVFNEDGPTFALVTGVSTNVLDLDTDIFPTSPGYDYSVYYIEP